MISKSSSKPMYNHLVIPLALVFILGILLFPLPTWLIDICISLNMTISFVVLFASLYMDRPLQFSSFPAILLITTMFRLGMNVASTRLILLNGDQGLSAAGEVIEAFGEFVVGGNYAVGIVIFIAINIVNLKVITKGSGRIAEVAARFTLDAMPGKQMAIDSDLNTGLIGEAEAKERRKDLQREAEFYGAMDGAAKFVAGDAIAGVIITGINIVGGFFIGIVQHEMDWKLSAATFTILTIGDGLVSQIPSIIVSLAAGLIVARAASGEDLGTEVLGQLSLSSKPLTITSTVCAALAVLPGMPFTPFIILSGLTAAAAYIRQTTLSKTQTRNVLAEKEKEDSKAPKPGSAEEVTGLLGMDLLELEVGYELVSLVEGGDLVDRIRSLRRQFASDYGIVIPSIHIRDNVRIKPGEYRFMLKGAIIGQGELKSNCLLAMDPGTVNNPITGIPTKEPAFGLDAIWIQAGEKESAQFSGYTVVDHSTIITTHVTEILRANLHELLGRQETQHLVDNLQKSFPKVIEELIPNLMTIGQVQRVLAHLLKEQVSIRDLRTILETLADWAPTIKHPERLAEYVRRRLSRSITAKYLSPEGILPLTNLNPALERALSDAVQQNDEGSFLALEPNVAQMLITRLNRIAEKFAEIGSTPLVLVPSHLRAALANFADRFVPGVQVISHQEIAPNTRVQSLGVISIE
ncbi:MAG: flagellar biosynthesis protein FlhA [Proteobacteria bacterium]|nr:MAG: flagellar biosynthesis protein FlhA [Pseudomonadota bacterium]